MSLEEIILELNNLECYTDVNCNECINSEKCSIILYNIEKIINSKN